MTPDTEAGPAGTPAARPAGRICVLADDLTGAADSGVAFVRPGAEVILALDPDEPGCGEGCGRVTVVDTDTREASPFLSGATMRALAARTGPHDHVLKKIDSLLRGQVAAELAALRETLPGRLVLAAPAVPALGRVTVDGVIRAADSRPPPAPDGSPGAGAARDARADPAARPADGIALAGRLGKGIRVIGLADVRGGALGRSLAAARDGGQLAACDAATDQDLDEIVAAGLALGTPVLWAGAAGLAAALARALLGPAGRRARPGVPRAAAPLLIIGSHSLAAREQVRALLAAGVPGIGLGPRELLAMPGHEQLRRAADLARVSAAGPAVVWLDGAVDHDARPAVAAALGQLCAPAVAAARVVIAAGGATARAVLIPAGVTALALLGELEPGAVLSRAMLSRAAPDGAALPGAAPPGAVLPGAALSPAAFPGPAPTARPRPARHVITKSGSFGDAATLVRLVTAITQPEGTG